MQKQSASRLNEVQAQAMVPAGRRPWAELFLVLDEKESPRLHINKRDLTGDMTAES